MTVDTRAPRAPAPTQLEREFHEQMREQSTNLRRLIEMLTVPVLFPVPRGSLAASELGSIKAGYNGWVLYGAIFTKVGGASQVKVHVGGNFSPGSVCDNINIAAGDPQVGVVRLYGNGYDIEDGVSTEVVAGTMDVIYMVGRRANAVQRAV